MRSWKTIPGWFDHASIFDAAIAMAKDGDVFVELGCWLGRSTAYLGQKIKEAKKNIRVYAVDHCFGSPEEPMQSALDVGGGNIAGALLRNLQQAQVLDTVIPICTAGCLASPLFAVHSLAFVFIDGEHSYEAVLRDLNTWRCKVRKGGLFAGHDYPYWQSVVRAVDEYFKTDYKEKPCRAVDCHSCWSCIG